VRLGVYTDYTYRRVGGRVYAERAFALFLASLRGSFDRLVLVGRLSADAASPRYPVGDDVELVALPYYPRLSEPLRVLPALARSLVTFWRALPGMDTVWLLGPHPLAIAFAWLAAARRKRVVLGVRHDSLPYVRGRHPGRRGLLTAAAVLEGAFRALALVFPVVVVGPELARKYRRSPQLLEIAVSLVREDDLVDPRVALDRGYDRDLRALTVGRLEPEKNPLLLVDVLERLNEGDGAWTLLVCGEGELRDELAARLAHAGQAERAELLGYVPFGNELARLYRTSHVLLHASRTEGFPQVLLEAFAAGLPVVASDVGGIRDAAGDAVLLFPADDVEAAVAQVRRVAAEPDLRGRLVRAGHEYVRARTTTAELRRVSDFLRESR
jgi:glycosyltransferase involved in cell wall biosynthesis